MTLYLKYLKFLKESQISEDLRSGIKDVASVDVDEFNFGAEYEFVVSFDRFGASAGTMTKQVIKDIETTLGIKISGGDKFVTQKKATTQYRLTYDDSVKSDVSDDFASFEFITPVISHAEFLNITKKLFDLIEQKGWETSSSAGLHVGISFKDPAKNQSLDPLKLVVFSGDQFMRNTWPRIRQKMADGSLSQDYVKSNIEKNR